MSVKLKQRAKVAYDAILPKIGEISVLFGCLDETLQEVLCLLLNSADREIGYVVYDRVAKGHGPKVELIQDLLKVRFNVFDPTGGEDNPLDSLTTEQAELWTLLSTIKILGCKRDKFIHRVYRAWFAGVDGTPVEISDLRKSYKNTVITQPNNTEQVTPNDLADLAQQIRQANKTLVRLGKKLLTTG